MITFANRVCAYIKRAVCAAVCIAVLITVCAGCTDAFSKVTNYSLSEIPGNLDPQTVTGSEACMITNHIFEGIYRRAADGGYELGAANNVSVSEDGLVYTFSFPQNVYWKYVASDNKMQDGVEVSAPVTAHDFVFAFQRLLSPDADCPYASNYYFIQNARQVNQGDLPLDELGVTAISDYELTIRLEHTTPLLQELLAAPAAMPCNEDFFNRTQGRYGLNENMLLCNGPFYVNSWVSSGDSQYIRVRPNANYHDAASVSLGGVNFTVRSASEALSMFDKKEIDTAIISADQCDEMHLADEQKQAFQGSVRGIVFNQNQEYFSNPNVRKALAMDVDRENCRQSMRNGETVAAGIIPPAVTVGAESYRDLTGSDPAPAYNAAEAASLWERGLAQLQAQNKQLQDINTLSLLVCDTVSTDAVHAILQGWQRDLGVYLRIDVQPYDEYQKRLKTGNFDCAYVDLTSSSDSPAGILSQFEENSSLNVWRSGTDTLSAMLEQANQQSDAASIAQAYYEAEQSLLNDGIFIPVAYETEYFVWQKKLTNVLFDPASRQLYFAYAKVS